MLDELSGAMTETWKGLQDFFSFSVLANPIEASKGDGEMSGDAMGMMSSKFGSAIAAYSYLIFVLLYVPCISVLGAITRESSRGWMLLSALWGVNVPIRGNAVLSDGHLHAPSAVQRDCDSHRYRRQRLLIACLYRCRDRFQPELSASESTPCCQPAGGESCH